MASDPPGGHLAAGGRERQIEGAWGAGQGVAGDGRCRQGRTMASGLAAGAVAGFGGARTRPRPGGDGAFPLGLLEIGIGQASFALLPLQFGQLIAKDGEIGGPAVGVAHGGFEAQPQGRQDEGGQRRRRAAPQKTAKESWILWLR